MSFFFRVALGTLVLQSLSAAPAVVVTTETLAARIRAQNPDLVAARWRISEAWGRVRDSGRPENPRVETSFQHNRAFREGALEVGFFQRFPVTDRLTREKEISLAEVKAAELEVRGAEQKLIADARAGFIEVLANRQRRELYLQQSALTEQLAKSISEAAAKGEGSLLDAGQARVDAMQSTAEVRQLEAQGEVALGALKAMLGIRPDENLVVSGKLGMAHIPGVSRDPSRRADYQLARLESEIAAKSADLERAKRYEDWEAGAFVAGERSEDAPSGYENETMVGIKLSIPLPFWNRNEGKIEEADARRNRKLSETKASALKIGNEADAALSEMRQWSGLISEIETNLLPLATRQAADTEAAWRNGQADFQAVLRSRAQRLQLSVSKLDALRDFHLARARHQAALGHP